MSTTSRLPVLVVGGGPTGLVLALTLLKNGIPVRIIQKDDHFHIGQRGAGVQPRTLEAYNLLGVLPDVLEQGIPMVPLRLYKGFDGVEPIRTFDLVPVKVPTPSTPYANVIGLGQAHAEEILRSHLAKHGYHVELSTELRDFQQQEDHVVAKLMRRVDDQEIEETVLCNWLVGADGGKGIVRKLLGLTFLGESLTQKMVFGEVHIQGLSRDYWHMWGDVSESLVILRPTEYEGIINYMIMGPATDFARIYSDDNELIKFMRHLTGNKQVNFGNLVWKSDYRPNARMVSKLGEGRVFLAGDAAHIHSPTGAQGMNSSVQDALNLGWKLALVEKGLSSPELLHTYNEERIPIIKHLLQRTTALFNTMFSDSQDSGPRGYGDGWTNTDELKMLGVNYRWSSIVLDERTPRETALDSSTAMDAYGAGHGDVVCAGDRAPEAPGLVYSSGDGSQSTSIFRMLGASYHTALIFTADTTQCDGLLDALKVYTDSLVRKIIIHPKGTTSSLVDESIVTLVDQDGHAYREYGVVAGDVVLVIIRPDGVIGAIVTGRDGLERYMNGVCSMLRRREA